MAKTSKRTHTQQVSTSDLARLIAAIRSHIIVLEDRRPSALGPDLALIEYDLDLSRRFLSGLLPFMEVGAPA
jgi:hypothetical protein